MRLLCQDNGLVATQACTAVKGVRIHSTKLHIAASACNEEPLRLGHCMEPSKVDIPTVHYVESAGLDNQRVQNRNVSHLTVRYPNERRDRTTQITKGVKSDGTLLFLILSPRKYGETQLDGGGIQSINRFIQLDPEFIVNVKRPSESNEYLGEISVNTPVAFSLNRVTVPICTKSFIIM